VLTEEEKELLEKDFVGRNGEKRKLEVSSCIPNSDARSNLTPLSVDNGTSKTKKVFPI
jgi:hypothetical protein